MGMGKVSVEGYTRVVNGKPVKVKPYSQTRSLMDALARAGRRPVAASSGQYAGGRSMPTSPVKRKAAKKEMAATLNAAKKRAVVAPKKAADLIKVHADAEAVSKAVPAGSHEARMAAKQTETEKKYPKGSKISTVVYGIGGKQENVTGEVIGYKGGSVVIKTESHGNLVVESGKINNTQPDAKAPIKKAANNELTESEKKEPPFKEGPGRSIDTPPEDEGAVATPPEVLKALSGINPVGRPEGAGTLADPIDVGDDLERAVTLIAEGKHVRLRQVDEVSMVLDRLAKRVEHAKKLGDKAPNFNLCLITVPGTNLFCTESKGVPRAKMPQLSGQPTEGSRAWDLRNEKGEAHIEDAFRQALKDTGVKVELKTVLASHLKASQAELDGPKVAGMSKAMEAGKIPDAPIFVTKDGYIVDGHHRWASKVAIDLKDGVLGDVDMPVEEIDLDIGAVLDFANEFALAMGIKPKGLGAAAEGVTSSDSADPLVSDAVDPLDAVAEAVAHLQDIIKKSKKPSTTA